MRVIRKPYKAHCERNRGATEEFLSQLPRSMEGEGLIIVGRRGDGVVISDGARAAVYVPCKDGGLAGQLRIEKGNTEPGWFMEAAVVFIGNGKSTILYEPLKLVEPVSALKLVR